MRAARHGVDGKGQAFYMLPLAGKFSVLDGNPSSLINLALARAELLVVKGVPDVAYRMPQFRPQLTDEQIAQVAGFAPAADGATTRPR